MLMFPQCPIILQVIQKTMPMKTGYHSRDSFVAPTTYKAKLICGEPCGAGPGFLNS